MKIVELDGLCPTIWFCAGLIVGDGVICKPVSDDSVGLRGWTRG